MSHRPLKQNSSVDEAINIFKHTVRLLEVNGTGGASGLCQFVWLLAAKNYDEEGSLLV